jgi:hypothetical protein
MRKSFREFSPIVVSLVALAAISLTAARPALADECNDAVLDYNAILSRLTDAMQNYSTCIADSKGNDTCARAFRKLQLAQDQFESSVKIYIKTCL